MGTVLPIYTYITHPKIHVVYFAYLNAQVVDAHKNDEENYVILCMT